ncbi:multidrug ABC transporter ATPase [Limosilactobacillus panis]|uniref:Multidrug ABC transporter ATPase n=1 Tax=Limosilactobacillus panis TaxID=47493 RepID=A0ABT7VM43_9LACO|nr:multidrug ABC transporter ATPase [Limosilactobacillus panis]MDM8333813.1 multidrug ABC transporter ATPase [Limosilactobacillus panis]
MSSVVLSNLTFEAKSGDQLEEVSLGLMSPKMVAICSDNAGTVLALEQLLMDQGKIIEGSAQINGEDITKYKRHPERVVASFDQTVLKGKTVEKAIARALKHVKGALDVTQTLQMLLPLGIKYDEKVATLSAAQQQELRIIILLALRRPVVFLSDGLDQLSEESRQTIGNLVKDYAKKTNSVVIFTSSDVSTMMRFADTIYYFSSDRLTSARDLGMNDGVDCTVTVTGTGLPIDVAIKLGAHMLGEAQNQTRFLYTGNIQALLPLLEQSTITDVRIEDSSVEDELMAY